MLFAVPINSTLTVTDTPVSAKSVRSFHFVDRGNGKDHVVENGLITCSISIDGKEICKDLFVIPFCTTQTMEENLVFPPFDSRRVDIRCNLNVCMSEIKISASNMMDFDVVFELSETEVETEEVECIESFGYCVNYETMKTTYGETFIGNVPCLPLKELKINEEQIIQLRNQAERIFGWMGIWAESDNRNMLYNAQSPNSSYLYFMQNASVFDLKLTLGTGEGTMPKNMPLNMICPALKTTWKDVDYTFDNKIDKNFPFTVSNQGGSLGTDNDGSVYFIVLNFITNKKL